MRCIVIHVPVTDPGQQPTLEEVYKLELSLLIPGRRRILRHDAARQHQEAPHEHDKDHREAEEYKNDETGEVVCALVLAGDDVKSEQTHYVHNNLSEVLKADTIRPELGP